MVKQRLELANNIAWANIDLFGDIKSINEIQRNIKLIDFNDSIIAPFDFDLRLLYMSVTLPWRWANIEMDPYQKKRIFNIYLSM